MRDPRWGEPHQFLSLDPKVPTFADVELTNDFRQYAIFKQELLTPPTLTPDEKYVIPCANVEKGKNLAADKYSKGQASNPDFKNYVNQLVNGC